LELLQLSFHVEELALTPWTRAIGEPGSSRITGADLFIFRSPKVASSTELQIQPEFGARGIHKLDANTPVTLVKSDQGWVLVAKGGKLIGYVAQGDLAPLQ
jgi:hypothetical protein